MMFPRQTRQRKLVLTDRNYFISEYVLFTYTSNTQTNKKKEETCTNETNLRLEHVFFTNNFFLIQYLG